MALLPRSTEIQPKSLRFDPPPKILSPVRGPRFTATLGGIRQVPGGLSPGNSISKSPVALTKSARFLQDIVMHICEVVEEEVVGVSIGLMMEF